MKHKCSFCAYQTDDIVACGQHYETMHKQMIPKGMSGEHFAYFIKTGRKNGNCVVCKRPTQWNPQTHKYQRICSVRCARKYGEIKQLNNPKVQEQMLSHRKISGVYTWSTADAYGQKQQFTYTGSYELDFLKYMDQVKHWPVNDLLMPCPILFSYTYDRQKRFYIPDAYIPSLDLVIEIKDGDPSNPNHHANHHPDIMRVNRAKEKLKKQAVNQSGHHYMVIYNKEYQGLDMYVRTNNTQYLSEDINSILTSATDAVLDYLDDPKKILLDILDDWKEFVSENKWKEYCELSLRLNEYAYDQIDSDKFDELLSKPEPHKEMVKDILYVGDGKVDFQFSIMDSDTLIKERTNDPYIIYSPKYTEAKKELRKWKKLNQRAFLGANITYEYNDDHPDTRRLLIQYDNDSD